MKIEIVHDRDDGKQDVMCIPEHIKYIYDYMELSKHNITYTTSYGTPPVSPNPLYRFESALYWKESNVVNNKVAIWTGEDNIFFNGKEHLVKNPLLGNGEWDTVKSALVEQGFDLVEISYRNTIDDNFNKIKKCFGCVGYNGMAMSIAKLMGKPALVICDNPIDEYSAFTNKIKYDGTNFKTIDYKVNIYNGFRDIETAKRLSARFIDGY